ncbi:hypothetical protein C8R43DRAFT_1128075 [Mycena crocata]|nr:hypothetical protein C8R43DRAFT_1128075 [Mycena crocata]
MLDISHTGEGALAEEQADQTLLNKLLQHQRSMFPWKDHRTREDCTQVMVDVFAHQMEDLTNAYVAWSLTTSEEGLETQYEESAEIIIDNKHTGHQLLSSIYLDVRVSKSDLFVPYAFVRQGMMPISASCPEVVLTICMLKVLCRTSLRCLCLCIQAFVRTLCDIHNVPPRPYLSVQFTVAFDLYLVLRAAVDKHMQTALGRNTPNWHMKNMCPSCMYKLEGEPELLIPTLLTIDGNKSLSSESRERLDNRSPPGNRYLLREEVEKWSQENLAELMKAFPVEEAEEEGESGCSERWQNMKEDVTTRAYGMYDETGIFPALCRHGFCLIIVDMVKSGELAQYGYAVAAHLMRILGPLGLGYDIGCKFAKMDAMGVPNRETFETWLDAERCFLDVLSKELLAANGVSPEAAHSGEPRVHLRRAYAGGVGKCAARDSCQLSGDPPRLVDPLNGYELGGPIVTDAAPTHLERKSARELPLETKSLSTGEVPGILRVLHGSLNTKADIFPLPHWLATRSLGCSPGNTTRVSPWSAEWDATEMMVQNRCYQHALNHLEGLVMAQMFELTKGNMSGMGYKLCKHIAKALQSRSRAVRAAMNKYNAAAMGMTPPRTTITWETVVEYVFLADFDLLHNRWEDIQNEPWAQPSGQAVMDQHFKLLHANEEIIRLDVETPQLRRLSNKGSVGLAHQVCLHQVERGRFNVLHMQHLVKLSKTPSFTASLVPGVSVCKERRIPDDAINGGDACMGSPTARPLPVMRAAAVPPANEPKEDVSDDEQDVAAVQAYEHIVHIAHDGDGPRPDVPS